MVLLAGCGLAAACAEPLTYVPYPVANQYRKQQKPRLLRPGWRLIKVGRRVDHPQALFHEVHVIPEIAGDLVMMSHWKRSQLVGEIACPPADHHIWESLATGQDVEIDLSTEKRGVFATVSCRDAVF